MSSTSSLVLQTATAGDEALVAEINSILSGAGKTMPLAQVNPDAQVGSKILEVNIYVYTVEKNRGLVNEIENVVRLFRDDVGDQDGLIVLLVSDDDGFTRVIRPGCA